MTSFLKRDIKDYIDYEFEDELKQQRVILESSIEELARKRLAQILFDDQVVESHPWIGGMCTLRLPISRSLSCRVKDTVALSNMTDKPNAKAEPYTLGYLHEESESHQTFVIYSKKAEVVKWIHTGCYLRVDPDTKVRDQCSRLYSMMDSLLTNHSLIRSLSLFFESTESSMIPIKQQPTFQENRAIDDISKMNGLNASQKLAVINSILTSPFYLIHGPPGTGKSHALTKLVESLYGLGCSILVSCSSNSAVDSLLLKVALSSNIKTKNIVRVGNIARGYRETAMYNWGYSPSYLESTMQDRDYKMKRLDEARIVFATHTGCFNPTLFDRYSQNRFDFVIIDEASQSPLATILMCMALGKRAIMAGDHCQLPAVIKTQFLPSLKESLFEKMMMHNLKYSVSQDLSSMLSVQHRMNELICLPSSVYFYQGRLASFEGNKKINLRNHCQSHAKFIDINVNLCWVDHKNQESKISNGNIRNYGEVESTLRIILDLVQGAGVKPGLIVVITSFKSQKDQILEGFSLFYRETGKDLSSIHVGTVDSYQGKESEVVIYSAVRSNDQGEIGFLREERRLNVAITRAKRMFILVGSSDLLVKKSSFLSLIYRVTSLYGQVLMFDREIQSFFRINETRACSFNSKSLLAEFGNQSTVRSVSVSPSHTSTVSIIKQIDAPDEREIQLMADAKKFIQELARKPLEPVRKPSICYMDELSLDSYSLDVRSEDISCHTMSDSLAELNLKSDRGIVLWRDGNRLMRKWVNMKKEVSSQTEDEPKLEIKIPEKTISEECNFAVDLDNVTSEEKPLIPLRVNIVSKVSQIITLKIESVSLINSPKNNSQIRKFLNKTSHAPVIKHPAIKSSVPVELHRQKSTKISKTSKAFYLDI